MCIPTKKIFSVSGVSMTVIYGVSHPDYQLPFVLQPI